MRRTLTTLTSLTLLISLHSTVDAYSLRTAPNGDALIWNTRAVSVEVDARPLAGAPGATDAIQASFATWEAAGAPVKVTLEQTTSPAPGDQDKRNTVRFEKVSWTHGEAVVGLTLATYYVNSGLVFETDIVLDAVNRRWSTAAVTPAGHFDVRNVVTHEVGHFMGLGHSADQSATMFAHSHEEEQDKRTLCTDDLSALAAVVAEMDRRLGASSTPPPTTSSEPIARASTSPLPARRQMGCTVAGGSGLSNGTPAILILFGLFFVLRRYARRTHSSNPSYPSPNSCRVSRPNTPPRSHPSCRVPDAAGHGAALAVALGVFVSVFVISSTAQATLVRALPLDKVLQRADVALEATVVKTKARRQGKLIVTDVTLRPARCWRGSCDADTVLQVLGGEVNGVGLHVGGAPKLVVGQQVIVLARKQGKALRAVGLSQGVFHLSKTTAVRDLRGLALQGVDGKTRHGVIQKLPRKTLELLLRTRLSPPRLAPSR